MLSLSTEEHYEFPFPSNGKAHSDHTICLFYEIARTISFDSLQTGRHIQTITKLTVEVNLVNVSIPFKREGTFRQPMMKKTKSSSHDCFNSLQTGRHIQTLNGVSRKLPRRHQCFNSLQTGRHIQTKTKTRSARKGKCFNSLQTGRHIQTVDASITHFVFTKCFNSLQTGRHIQTGSTIWLHVKPEFSFNSLQTGRHIQTCLLALVVKLILGFNSLQTGRHIQTC